MLNVDQLSFGYHKTPVLQNISFQVNAGRLCALFGPNGSGKTTLFKCCLNFLKFKGGVVQINGEDVQKNSVKEMARIVAYVPQEHKAPFPYTVKEVVLMGRTPHLNGALGVKDEDKRIVVDILEKLDILTLASRPYNELSGGQRQLVLLARALAQQTELIFLDEPAASLDFKNQLLIWKVLQTLVQQGKTVFVCTHDPNHVLWFCDQVIVINQGKIIANGQPKDSLNENTLQELYGPVCDIVEMDGLSMVAPKGIKGMKNLK
jgi:iron complex transport system ATP-binding protein